MTTDAKLRQGTLAWFDMVGRLMCEAAAQARLSPDLTVSLVERYSDGILLSDGLVQGLRFDIVKGVPSFRSGARPGETADIAIEITAAAALRLNTVVSTDPAYAAALDRFLATGEMRVEGNPSSLGAWLEAVHDPIVALTI